MYKSFLIIFTLFFSLNLFSQQPHWEWVKHAGSGGDDIGNTIIINNCNEIVIVGQYGGYANFDNIVLQSPGFYNGLFIAKQLPDGNFISAKGFDGSNVCYAYSVASDSNCNNYIIGGFGGTEQLDSISLNSLGSGDIHIFKTDTNNHVVWAKSAGSKDVDGGLFIKYNKSSLYAAGECSDSAYFDTTLITEHPYGIFISKLDTNGNYVWLKNFINTNIRSMDIDKNSNLYITGYLGNSSVWGIDTLTSNGSSDAIIAKLDSNGNTLWALNVGNNININGSDGGLSITHDNFNNVFVLGHFRGQVEFGNTTLTATTNLDIFIAKLDSSGNFLWAKKMNIDFSPIDSYYFNSIACDTLGNLYLTVWFMNTLQYENVTFTSNGSYDIAVMKLDPNGNVIWAKQTGGTDIDFSSSLTLDKNQNIYITGRFNDTAFFDDQSITSYGSADIFIAKLSQVPVNVESTDIEKQEFKLYPNPNNGTMKFEYQIQEQGNFIIYDIIGKKVYFMNIKEGKNNILINSSDLSNGVYYYQVITGNHLIKTEKLIINK